MRIDARMAERIGIGVMMIGPMIPLLLLDHPSHYRLVLALAVIGGGACLLSRARRRLKAATLAPHPHTQP